MFGVIIIIIILLIITRKASNAGILFFNKTHTYTSTHTQPHILSTQQRILLREKKQPFD